MWPYVLAATPGYLVQTGASCNHTTGKTAMPFCVRTREALAKAGIDPEKDINYEHQLQSGAPRSVHQGDGGYKGGQARWWEAPATSAISVEGGA